MSKSDPNWKRLVRTVLVDRRKLQLSLLGADAPAATPHAEACRVVESFFEQLVKEVRGGARVRLPAGAGTMYLRNVPATKLPKGGVGQPCKVLAFSASKRHRAIR